jgi:hemolysin activation/secretion protein
MVAGAEAQNGAPDTGQTRGLVMDKPSVAPAERKPPPKRELKIEKANLPDGVVLPDVPDQYARTTTAQSPALTGFLLEGSTIFGQSEVDGALQEFVGRSATFETLQQARNALTLMYNQKGYVSSGVILPDQEVVDGKVRFTAQENGLTAVRVSGNRHLSSKFVEQRVRRDLGSPLNVNELEKSLRLIQQYPQINTIDARVTPGELRGASVLDLTVKEAKPMLIVLGFDNHRSPSVGEEQYRISLSHQSLTGRADYLLVDYGVTEGNDSISIRYGLPVTSRDLTLELGYDEGESDIVEDPFDGLGIVSRTDTWGLRLTRPIIRSLNSRANVGIAVERTRSRGFVLGTPFSFSAGE